MRLWAWKWRQHVLLMAQKETVAVSNGWSPRMFLECWQTYEYAGWDWALRALMLPGDGGLSNARPHRAAGANPEGYKYYIFFFPQEPEFSTRAHARLHLTAETRTSEHRTRISIAQRLNAQCLKCSLAKGATRVGHLLLDQCLLPPPPKWKAAVNAAI